MQEVNLANNKVDAIPHSWINSWGNLNSAGKLSLHSPASDAPVITLLGNPLKMSDTQEICLGLGMILS